MADCLACARPQPDTAYVCAACSGKLGQALNSAAALVPELETAVAKLARFGEPGPRSRGRAPAAPIRPGGDPAEDHQPGWPSGLIVNLAAAEVRDDVANTVGSWCRVVAEERYGKSWVDCLPGEVITGSPRQAVGSARVAPGDVRSNRTQAPILGQAMQWLASQLEWLRHQRFADECFDELGDAARQVARAVDRPAERVDAGVCLAVLDGGEKCQRRLSAPPGAARVRCPGCGATHDAQARRQTFLAEARSQRGTATEVARWLTLLGMPTPAATVRKWAQRGRLACDQAGMYAFAETERLRMRESRSAA